MVGHDWEHCSWNPAKITPKSSSGGGKTLEMAKKSNPEATGGEKGAAGRENGLTVGKNETAGTPANWKQTGRKNDAVTGAGAGDIMAGEDDLRLQTASQRGEGAGDVTVSTSGKVDGDSRLPLSQTLPLPANIPAAQQPSSTIAQNSHADREDRAAERAQNPNAETVCAASADGHQSSLETTHPRDSLGGKPLYSSIEDFSKTQGGQSGPIVDNPNLGQDLTKEKGHLTPSPLVETLTHTAQPTASEASSSMSSPPLGARKPKQIGARKPKALGARKPKPGRTTARTLSPACSSARNCSPGRTCSPARSPACNNSPARINSRILSPARVGNLLNPLHAHARGLRSPSRPACARARSTRKASKLARSTRHASVPPMVHSPTCGVDSAEDDEVADALVVAVNGKTTIDIKDMEEELEKLATRGRPKERIDDTIKKKMKGKGVLPSSQQ